MPPAPIVVFFYGGFYRGRWEAGNKADYRFVGQAFASRGFVVVIADYRSIRRRASRPSSRTAQRRSRGCGETSAVSAASLGRSNSEHLAAALEGGGNRAELKLYPNLNHVTLVAALAAPLRRLAPVLDDVTAFLRATPPPSF